MTHHRSSSLLVDRPPQHYLLSPTQNRHVRRVSVLAAAGQNAVIQTKAHGVQITLDEIQQPQEKKIKSSMSYY